jgi:antitoxin CptB
MATGSTTTLPTAPAQPVPESPELQYARLAWQCRRGMKELDLLLQSFLQRGFSRLSTHERRAFDALLRYPDPMLIDYLMGKMIPLDREIADVVVKIRRES